MYLPDNLPASPPSRPLVRTGQGEFAREWHAGGPKPARQPLGALGGVLIALCVLVWLVVIAVAVACHFPS